MRKSILLLIFSLLAIVIRAQTWTDITPASFYDLDYYGIAFRDDSTGFALTNQGYLFRTDNAGKDWYIQEQLKRHMRDLHFFNKDTGILLTYKAFYRTTDGGDNWELGDTVPLKMEGSEASYGSLSYLYFLNDTLGYAFGSSYAPGTIIWKTVDGGINWEENARIQKNMIDEISHSMHFIDKDTGFVFGRNNFYVKTTNGGDSWNKYYYPGEEYSLTCNFFFDSLHGYAGDINGKILETHDGGNSWELFYNTSDLNAIVKIHFFDTARAIAFTADYFYQTYNGGLDWDKQSTESWKGNLLYDIHILNDSTFFIVGDKAVLTRTTDSGQTWDRFIHGAPQGFGEVFFTDENTGYVCIENGRVMKTANGGDSWEIIQVAGQDAETSTLFFTSDSTGYMGNTDTIYKTTDAGNTWKGVTVDIPADDFLVFPSPDTGYAGTDFFGFMLKTYDAGESWQVVSEFKNKIDGYIGSASFPSARKGYITGGGADIPHL